MTQDLIVNRVESSTTGVPGRSVNRARDRTLLIDEPAYQGGPGVEMTPAEAFLSGVSACGVLLVEKFAREQGVPLTRAEASIEGVRHASDPSRFVRATISFRLAGPDERQAADLVARYKAR